MAFKPNAMASANVNGSGVHPAVLPAVLEPPRHETSLQAI